MTTFASTLTIDDLLRGDIQLSSPPAIYLALTKVVEDPAKTAQDAAVVIENDAALSIRLLKIVNSAFYGFPSKIDSIARAITMVGTRELQNLVLATIVIERFSNLPGSVFSIHDFWSRNLRCALIAREMDGYFGKKYRDIAFLCGLLHNIGQLVLYRRIPVLAREVDLLIQAQASRSVCEADVERQVIGFDHFEVGAKLCRLWKLPEIVTDSIWFHEDPKQESPHASLAAMVRSADFLSKTDTLDYALTENELHLAPEQIALILEKTHAEFEIIFRLFYPVK